MPGLLPALQCFGVPGRGPAYGTLGGADGLNPVRAIGSIERTETRIAFSRNGDVAAYERAIQAFDHFPDAPTELELGKRPGSGVAVVDEDSAGREPAWVCWRPMRVSRSLDACIPGDLILGRDP